MATDALIAVGAGLFSALLAMAFLGGSPMALLLVYVASLPLFLSGLGLGMRAATISVAAGFMGMGMFGGAAVAGLFGLVHALPAWMTTRMVLLQRPAADEAGTPEWYPPGPAIAALTCLGAALLVLAAAFVGGDGLQATISKHLFSAFDVMAPVMTEAQRRDFVDLLVPLFPGMAAASWVIMAAVNAVLSQGLLVRFGRNLRPSPQYRMLELPQWLSWPLVASAALALLGSGEWEYMARNMALVLAVPYFFLGLTVVHAAAHRVAMTGALLAMFYLTLLFSGWAALVVAGIGITEQWLGLRGRFGLSGAVPPDNG